MDALRVLDRVAEVQWHRVFWNLRTNYSVVLEIRNYTLAHLYSYEYK